MTPEQASLNQACTALEDGRFQLRLNLDNLHCGGCVAKVERELASFKSIEYARVNLTTRSATLRWSGNTPPELLSLLDRIGYPARIAHTSDVSTAIDAQHRQRLRALLVALGISGFAAMNIMLLSVSVWSGADASTAHLFHVISAMIAVPAIVFSATIFFRQAWQALQHGRTNMDVPISIGILLATGASLYDTFIGDGPVYFEASLMLVFFLLIGRTLDYLSREKARRTVDDLARLQPSGAMVATQTGELEYRTLAEIVSGDSLRVAANERIPADGVIEAGRSEIDMALVTGESVPQLVGVGSHLLAGTLNLIEPITVKVTASAEHSFIAETHCLMLAAENGRGRYRRIADRAARLYAPVVHCAAALGFLGWLFATGDVHRSIGIAVAVLIITCPCALGLAVPMTQVVATRRLFNAGILVKDGAALERLAGIDTVVFDKTGTLTGEIPAVQHADQIDQFALTQASLLAQGSRHPHSQSLIAESQRRRRNQNERVEARKRPPLADREELPGLGIRATIDGDEWRLGKTDWANAPAAAEIPANASRELSHASTALSQNGSVLARFAFHDKPRDDAAASVAQLSELGLAVEVVSGDTAKAVSSLSKRLGVAEYLAEVLPADKLARIETLQSQGHRILKVGDGINDAPAMIAADVSMAPGNASDVGRSAADVIFLRGSLSAVPEALQLARRTSSIVRQNFAIALLYNLIALPLALAGFVTPLLAAIAMSSSSLLVVANAMRLVTLSTANRVSEMSGQDKVQQAHATATQS